MILVGFNILIRDNQSALGIGVGIREKDEMYGVQWHGFELLDLEEQIKIYEAIKQELEKRK